MKRPIVSILNTRSFLTFYLQGEFSERQIGCVNRSRGARLSTRPIG